VLASAVLMCVGVRYVPREKGNNEARNHIVGRAVK
jgi:hypothetical protein